MLNFLIAFQTGTVPDQTIRIEIQTSFLSQLVTWLIVGLIAGWLAGTLVRGRRMGFIGSLILGFLGAIIGGVVYTAIGLQPPAILANGVVIRWIDLIVAFCGSIFLIVIVGALFGFRSRRE
jgi:uncharacterized membrane protein YeaQ/YmgE (transglycosylase-associated protein family)